MHIKHLFLLFFENYKVNVNEKVAVLLNHTAVYCKTQFQRKLRERQTSFDEHN